MTLLIPTYGVAAGTEIHEMQDSRPAGHSADRYLERLWRRPVLAIDSYRMGFDPQLMAAGD
jgi:hypothetical protein